ncbi:histone deacetylase family protein [Maricaulis sp. MIT060901]|uniref:histone deacetylase family protein n=1 Tax=Maricaulis sp. MIT060901 TaxID=3096993 RepID=UPI00399A80EE
MSVLIVDSPASAGHAVPPDNPEHPGRYAAVRRALQQLSGGEWIESRSATRDELERFHTPGHVERVLSACAAAEEGGWHGLDWDTHVQQSSAAAGLHAAGAALEAVDRVMAGGPRQAFCLARPPGHHAEPDRVMGFCLFNSVAIAALHALEAYGLGRVAIIDIDVHHGNGSQCLAERDERVFFSSLHQAPLYPGTGREGETGLNGNVLNLTFADNSSSALWRQRFEAEVLPVLARFRPEVILVSAGFDAHEADPLGGLNLTDADYGWVAGKIRASADEFAHSRLVSVLEGGYDCPALGRAAAAFVSGLSSAP